MVNVNFRFLITTFSALFICNIVLAKESSIRTVRKLHLPVVDDDTDGWLPPNWVDPPYWAIYEPILSRKHLKTCAYLTAVPTDGSVCTTKVPSGWKTCLFGEQTCQATITGVMPGMGSITCDNNLGMVHPTTKCDCNGTTWKCFDWKICSGAAKQTKDFNMTRSATRPKQYGAMNQTNPFPLNLTKSDNKDGRNWSRFDLPLNLTKSDNKDGKNWSRLDHPLNLTKSDNKDGKTDFQPAVPVSNCTQPENADPNKNITPKPPLNFANPDDSKNETQAPPKDPTYPSSKDFSKPLIMTTVGVDPYIPPVQDPSKPPSTSVDTCPTQKVSGPFPNGGVCSTALRCSFGTESCCGQTYPSVVCSCQKGGSELLCHYTDACFNPKCKTNSPVITQTSSPVTIVTSTSATTDESLPVKPRDTRPPIISPTKLPYKTPTKFPMTTTMSPVQIPVTIISTEKKPDGSNNPLCPATLPTSLDKVPAGLPIKASCGYGTVCGCGTCRIATICLNNAGLFQCLAIPIKCTSTCPITATTLPPLLL